MDPPAQELLCVHRDADQVLTTGREALQQGLRGVPELPEPVHAQGLGRASAEVYLGGGRPDEAELPLPQLPHHGYKSAR